MSGSVPPPEESSSDPVPHRRPADAEDTGFPEVDDPDQARAEALAAEPGGVRAVTEVHRPSTLGGIVYLVVLGAALAGIGIAATGAWRSGVSWLALALLAAAVARVVLTDANAGMLRVRGKVLDVLLLTAMGVSLLVLAATIPNQPG